MVVKYMHHRDDLAEHRTREASFGAQYTNHSANFHRSRENLRNSSTFTYIIILVACRLTRFYAGLLLIECGFDCALGLYFIFNKLGVFNV